MPATSPRLPRRRKRAPLNCGPSVCVMGSASRVQPSRADGTPSIISHSLLRLPAASSWGDPSALAALLGRRAWLGSPALAMQRYCKRCIRRRHALAHTHTHTHTLAKAGRRCGGLHCCRRTERPPRALGLRSAAPPSVRRGVLAKTDKPWGALGGGLFSSCASPRSAFSRISG